MLSEDKYAPGETSRWKHVSARFPALYKALLDEPDQTVRRSMYRTAARRAGGRRTVVSTYSTRPRSGASERAITAYVEYASEEWRQ